MESTYLRLSQYLADLAKILQNAEPDKGQSQTEESELPHIELIDFDKLRQMLDETASSLEMAHALDLEVKVVRKWLIDRITALGRGQRAILGRRGADIDGAALNETSLPELVRHLDEVSASLRKSAVNYRLVAGTSAFRSADDFRKFKS